MLTSSLIQSILLSTRFSEGERNFSSVSTDTRTLQPDALFVPLVGERFNGHTFITTAIERGATAALWQEGQPVPKDLPVKFQLYFVKDTLHALQQMAAKYREQLNPTVIAITGSNGKTTTKDILFSLLSLHGDTYKTQGNYNNHIGLPLTILATPSTCQYLILEMGMSGFGEIELLSKIARPNETVVTNIGESHMEQLGSREGIATAKMEIRAGLQQGGHVYLDGDEPLLSPHIQPDSLKIGFSGDNDYEITDVQAKEDGYSFLLDGESYYLPLLGEHNVKNAAYCIIISKKLGLTPELIQKGLSKISLSGMRLQKQVGSSGELIINDAYNASPTSMIAAVKAIQSIPNYQNRIVVLGDMYELGSNEEQLHRNVAQAVKEPITHFLAIGDKAKWIADEWLKSVNGSSITLKSTSSIDEAAKLLAAIVNKDTVILFKASRGMKLEQLIDKYQSIGKGEV
ncbi:UDP-N-acetylmuramoyl-tripeptide--D-alanyl-D-alanine ligase [Halalkalibacter urbisdiaboli]|uniref:UDP-N-acetylmuramoyl-tripeptide--D-alanyl-D- alanine ligase n=1 Tax=Halalkalibacter urbisdiaboli TaxID=1960589 RepID=UPI000B44BC38|nr:UDP-N-acetylmuramoyl-tripeptide--D-alanyl-D-alanine ligase [Halalkalibacter urbisdiaboli]